ncbi:VOC family protein [Roseisolibacter sp. H3M3-2]|uniref:VOC family protein n=1 Tax=Roseisolibacter sp. H3M3-2 TaxID=3031323 RepID=UPI0023DC5E16|nr:VOC family protein [Roseisolibacter sp. H3M3-2]MDF1503585.1 VOC family protein [Roseisolibacter sp. H3M3-2]
MSVSARIRPSLWFDSDAEEAVDRYVSIFPNSRVVKVARYGTAGQEIHGRAPGSVMAVEFELDGTPMIALNGGPMFKFTPAVSLEVHCDSQAEIDHYWERLGEGGDPDAQQCGWLADRWGLSWQIVPRGFADMVPEHPTPASERAMNAMLQMKKLDWAALQRAYAGEDAPAAAR